MRQLVRAAERPGGRVQYFAAYGLSAFRSGCLPIARADLVSAPAWQVSIPEIEYSETLAAAGELAVAGLPRARAAAIEAALESVVRPMSLLVRIAPSTDAPESLPITVLPPWSWPLGPETRVQAATFVLPGDPAVVDWTRRNSDARSTAPTTGALEQCAALYRALREPGVLHWEAPRVQEEPWSETAHQVIRSAPEVLAASTRLNVNCVDLALTFAGLLEGSGFDPLVIFVGDRAAPPGHCLAGAWRDTARRFRPVLDDPAALIQAIDGGELIVFEPTGVCAGDPGLDFALAVEHGAARLRQSAAVQAIDIAASRPPAGRCAPLVVTNAPVVANAIASAWRLAADLTAKRRETAHLLYGLCATGGELTTWLLERCGTSAAQLAPAILKTLRHDGAVAPPIPTRNYSTCLGIARANARGRGAAAVDEADLLWALLESPSESVRKLLAATGCTLGRLQLELSSRCDRPGEATSHYGTAPDTRG